MSRQILQHIRSSQPNGSNNGPKLPTKEQIEYGELAINYLKDNETISVKNSADEIVTFSSDNKIYTGDGTSYIGDDGKANRGNNLQLGEVITASTEGEEVVFDSTDTVTTAMSKFYRIILDDEKVTAAALTHMNEELGFDENGNYMPSSTDLQGKTITKAIDSLLNRIASLETQLAQLSIVASDNSINVSSVNGEHSLNVKFAPSGNTNANDMISLSNDGIVLSNEIDCGEFDTTN